MQYHLVLSDEHGNRILVRTVEGHAAADRESRLLLADSPGWTPKRYPGRSWRHGEVGVYLDRTRSQLRELSILRCAADHDGTPLACPLRAIGIPALNLQPATAESPSAEPAPLPTRSR